MRQVPNKVAKVILVAVPAAERGPEVAVDAAGCRTRESGYSGGSGDARRTGWRRH
jgi:hypothetical protein